MCMFDNILAIFENNDANPCIVRKLFKFFVQLRLALKFDICH